MNPSRFACRSALLALTAVAAQAGAADLGQLLECRDAASIAGDVNAVTAAGSAAGYDCRVHERERETAAYCTGAGRGSAFGQPVKEFNLIHGADGGAMLQVVFNSSPSRISPLVAGAQAGAGQPLANAEVGTREDGVAELRCRIAGTRGTTGAIAGTLSFRDAVPLPAMRVCAASRRDPGRPVCAQTSTGQSDYLIEGLPAGEYYVTAYPLENNPYRLFMLYTSSMQPCPPDDETCVGNRLQPVKVFAGDVRSGIDPETLTAELPSPLQPMAMARSEY